MVEAAPSKPTTDTIPKIIELMKEVRKFDPEMPAQTLMTFLLVASTGANGVLQSELGPTLGITQAAVCRNVAFLGNFKGPGQPGHGLVDAEIVPENRRLRRITLTAKGKEFADRLGSAIR